MRAARTASLTRPFTDLVLSYRKPAVRAADLVPPPFVRSTADALAAGGRAREVPRVTSPRHEAQWARTKERGESALTRTQAGKVADGRNELGQSVWPSLGICCATYLAFGEKTLRYSRRSLSVSWSRLSSPGAACTFGPSPASRSSVAPFCLRWCSSRGWPSRKAQVSSCRE